MFCVYKHTLRADGRVYIGQTNDIKARWCSSGNKYKSCRHFWAAICKYGWDSFDHEVISSGLTKEEADVLEERLIAEYDSTNPKHGFNLRPGGNSSTPSEETRRRMSEAQSGEKHPNYNRKLPESHRNHIREAMLGEKNPFYGKKHTDEARKKIREKRAKQIPPSLGKHYTEQVKANMRAAKLDRAISVLCIETRTEYHGIKEAGRQTGIDRASISRCCKGKQNTAGGYHWRYSE